MASDCILELVTMPIHYQTIFDDKPEHFKFDRDEIYNLGIFNNIKK
jgi:hypothetical protein